jgi:hypothetical protein
MGKEKKLDIASAVAALKDWSITEDKDDLKVLTELTERSLKEVKALTEYEDGKAQRILVAIAFLAAVAGSVFTLAAKTFSDAGAVVGIFRTDLPVNWFASSVFAGFCLYAVLLAIGAAYVIAAVRPKFNIPSQWSDAQRETFPTSFLFFKEILKVEPKEWVTAYSKSTLTTIRHEYVRNSVLETYLVADKIRIKLGPLETGVKILWASTIALAFWLPLAILGIAAPKIGL